MKKVFAVLLFINFSLIAVGQNGTFSKKEGTDTTNYLLSDNVLTQWQGKEVSIFFQGEIPKAVWNNFITKHTSEAAAFAVIASTIARKADSFFDNSLSLEPSKTQYFKYDREKFTSSFDMRTKGGNNGTAVMLAFVEHKPKR